MIRPSNLPLNGTKTHPLSEHAKGVILQLSAGPVPRHKINPGVVDRLGRADFIFLRDEVIHLTSDGKAVGAALGWMKDKSWKTIDDSRSRVAELLHFSECGQGSGEDDFQKLNTILLGLNLLKKDGQK